MSATGGMRTRCSPRSSGSGSPWPPADLGFDQSRLQGGTFDDAGAALAVLSRQQTSFPGSSELERVDLHGAELHGCDFTGACFAHANLEGAQLTGAKLVGATCWRPTWPAPPSR